MARVKIDQRDPENEEDKELEDEGEDFEVPEPPISLHGSDFLEPKQQPVRDINAYFVPRSSRRTPREDAPSRQILEELFSSGSLVSRMGAALSKEDHIDDVVAAAQRMVSSPSGSPKAAPVTKPRDTDKATRGRPGKLTRQQRNTRQANPSNLVNSADVYNFHDDVEEPRPSGRVSGDHRQLMRGAKRKQSETRGPQVASTKRSRREEAGPREEAAARNKSKLLPNGYEVRRLQKDAEEFLNSSPPREAVGRPQKIAVNKPSNASSTPPQSTGKPSKKPKQTSKANAVEKRAAEKAVAQEAAAQSKRSPAETQKRARGRPKETAQEDQLFVQQDEAEPDDVVIDEDGEEEEVNEVPEPDENDGSEAEEEVSAEDAQQLCGQYGFVVQIRNVINTDTYRTKPRTKSVKDLYFKCKEIESQLDILKEDPQDPAQFDESWTAVRNGLTELRGLTAKVNPDTEKWPTQSIRDIYQAAFPSLVCVFSAYCKFLLSPASGELDPGAYAQAINIINITTGLRDRAIGPNGWKTRPDPSDALARPIVNDVIRPLKDIRVAFRREIASLQQQAKRREEGRRRREELERLEAQMTQQERDSERKTDQLNRLRELFLVRQEVEPDPKARRLLGEPGFRGSGLDNKENVPGTAATRRGPMVLQDRVEAFKTRRDALGRQMREWSAEQRGSLLEGLRRFQGRRNIFSLIIKAYCAASGPMYVRGRHASLSGPLRDFKVHEILREADYLQRVAFHENDRNPEMEIEECLDGDIADLDLIDLIWERYGL